MLTIEGNLSKVWDDTFNQVKLNLTFCDIDEGNLSNVWDDTFYQVKLLV